jgi:Flp pilus assembly pilin Flp
MRLIRKLWRDRRGQDLIEYALLLSFAAMTAAVFLPSVSNDIGTIYRKVASVARAAAGSHTHSDGD